ncbi:hypothetical protein M9Y10_008193 [Tritrichomonas musculus]|uniref:Uncharacterized protein n=1 Tax=Tritrichomonas musculus TaxID=1915356 RepID=A0ABR2IYH2_9EUKA
MFKIIKFFLFACIASATAEVEITVCDGDCPSSAIGATISYHEGDDLDDLLKQYLTDNSIVYFYTASKGEIDFKLSLLTFQGRKCAFKPLSGSLNFDIYINIDSGQSTGQLTFNGVDVVFTSEHATNLRIDVLKLIESQIDFKGVNSELYVGALTTDDSIHSFSQVNIVNAQYEHSQLTYDVTSSNDVTIAVSDKTVSVTIDDHKTKFVYQSDDMEAYFETNSGSKYYVNYTGGSQSSVPTLNFENFQNLIFSGDWPKTSIFPITDKRFEKNISISSYSPVLPISRDGTATTLIKLNDSTIITGSINCPIVFSLLRSVFLNDTYVSITGTYSGSLIDLGSSYIRLTIDMLQTDFSAKQYPFIFRVGTGGASTVSCLKTTELSTRMSQLAVYTDFQKFLTDFELDKLLSQEWNLLYLNMTLDVSKVTVVLQSEPFIHGFIPNDSCLTVLRMGQTFVLSATSPSSLPLNICYDGDQTTCDDGTYGAEIHNIDQLNTYFVGGIKVLRLTLKVSIDELDFSSFDASGGYQNCQISVYGSYQITVNKVSYGMQKGIDYMEFNYINFDGTSTFYINNVQFLHCNASTLSHFNFQNNQLVTGDDDFVRTFFSQITTNLKSFQYKMDHYDAISVDDKQYIFYDLDVNDYSTPISINYESVNNKFIQIIYDVGMTSTATENNLNITINTNSPPSFNVTFDVLSYDYRNEAELILYDWSKAKNADFKVNFDHGNYPVKIVLTEPYNPTQLNVFGDGKVTYIDRYSNTTELCACENDICTDLCPKNSSRIKYSEIDTKLGEDYNKFIIYIGQSNLAAEKPTVKMESLNKKVVNFIGLGGKDDKDLIIINNDNSYEVDQKLTTTYFDNLKVQPTSGTQRIAFGELRFDDCSIDSAFKNIEVSIDDFYCNFSDFQLFKRITISDSCFVGGALATESQTVQFLVDQDDGDLQATISVDAPVEMGDGYVKIGPTRFNIQRSFVYDVVLSINSGKKVTITKASDAAENKVPLVLFKNCKGSIISICDGWTSQAASSYKYTFLLEEVDEVTLILNGENTPLAVSSDKGDMTIISASKSVGINGFFEFTPSFSTDRSSITVKYSEDSPKLTESTIKFEKDFDIGYGCTIKFSQPNIVLALSRLIGTEKSQLSVEHYSNLDGDSKLTVDKAFKSSSISTDYKIQCSISKPLNDAAVANYINHQHVLFAVNTADSSSCKQTSLTFTGTAPTTHGFTSTNMKITVNEDTGEVVLGFIKDPNEVPWSLCYSTRTACEISIDESTISKLDTLLPGGKMNINILMGKANSNDLNLAIDNFKGSTLSVSSSTSDTFDLKVKYGQSILSSVSLTRMKATTSETDFSVSQLFLYEGSSASSIEKFGNLTVDFTSWENLHLSSYSKAIEIQYPNSQLTFTSGGWKLSDGKEIAKVNFPDLKVNFLSNSVELLADKGLTKVNDLKLITKSKKITVGENFDSIQSPDIFIESTISSDSLIVTMKSFPFVIFPYLMSAGTLQFDKSVLPYTTSHPFKLDGLNPIVDFSNSDQSHLGRLAASSIEFSGISSLSVKSADTYYPVSVESVISDNLSTVTLNQAKVTSSVRAIGSASLKGKFDVPNANVVFEWRLESMPQIAFNEAPESAPKSVTVKFVGPETESNLDASKYNEYLYEKAYSLASNVGTGQCDKWLSNLILQSEIRYFNSDECVFDVTCNNGNVILVGRRLIPDIAPPTGSDDGQSGKKLKTGAIVGIAIAVLVVVVAACVFGYMYYKKRRSSYESLDSVKLELNKQQYI